MKFTGPQGEIVSSNGSKAGDDFVAEYAKICAEQKEQERQWVKSLRVQGIKAAHPDDGWVEREENTVHFAYPQFDDGVSIGDLIALGWEYKFRVVKVIDVIQGKFTGLVRYRFTGEGK